MIASGSREGEILVWNLESCLTSEGFKGSIEEPQEKKERGGRRAKMSSGLAKDRRDNEEEKESTEEKPEDEMKNCRTY